jgi:3-polyprenyl-4-hydroxybenzoate decarboxylase
MVEPARPEDHLVPDVIEEHIFEEEYMPKDLRTWLKDLEEKIPGEPLKVSKEVNPSSYEVSSILHQLEEQGNLSAVLFGKVMWAVANCCQADSDVTILNNIQGHLLDPSLRQETRGSGIVVDATRSLDRPYPPKASVPQDVLRRIHLEDYIDF